MRIHYSGVNPTDWKTRIGGIHMPIPEGQVQVPHLDGSGIVDAVGPGVENLVPGDRVWLWLVAFKRLEGTAQEYATVPARLVRPLPDTASLELGAGLGVPFITAHHALTLRAGGPLSSGRGPSQGSPCWSRGSRCRRQRRDPAGYLGRCDRDHDRQQ